MIDLSPISKKKARLLVRKGDEYISLDVQDVIFIYRNDTVVFVIDKNEKKYLIDKNLSVLEAELDPNTFFRANRQYIININFVRGFRIFEKVKIAVSLKVPHSDHPIIISQKTAPLFKRWIAEED